MPIQYVMIYTAKDAWKLWEDLPDAKKREISEKAQRLIYRELGYKKKKSGSRTAS